MHCLAMGTRDGRLARLLSGALTAGAIVTACSGVSPGHTTTTTTTSAGGATTTAFGGAGSSCYPSCIHFSGTLAKANLDAVVRQSGATAGLFGISIHGGPPTVLTTGVWDTSTNRPVEPSNAFY